MDVLQPTFSKWSRGWYQNVNIRKKTLYNFCPNLIWTIDKKEFFFGPFINWKIEFSQCQTRSSVVDIFEMVMWLISKDWYFKEDTSWLLTKFDLNHLYKGVCVIRPFIGRKIEFSDIKLKYFSLHFWNCHLIDIKTLMLWFRYLIFFCLGLFGLILQKDFSLFIN